LSLALLGVGWAFAFPAARGWALLTSVACLAEVLPTFYRGERYRRHRATILRWDGRWARAFRPLARFLGHEDAWILSFCGWNNRRVRELFQTHPAQRALVLLPHCIQMARCKAEVVENLAACHQCGLCPVGDVLDASSARSWRVRLFNRSHKAYREALETNPDLMIAVACPDRLFKGLTNLPDVPGYVIPLSLPHGMCVDTTFSVPHLSAALETLVEPKGSDAANVQPLILERNIG